MRIPLWICGLSLLAACLVVVINSRVHIDQAPSACQDQFYEHKLPTLNDPNNAKTYILCFTKFGLQNSALTKTPLWSAEHLTQDRITAAKEIKRRDEFHPEPQITVFQDRATLADYLGSGYDRGHMSPNKDMPDSLSGYESFSLSNMVPQNPCNNEIIWAAIEGAVRKYGEEYEIYVITGPVFEKDHTTIGGNKVWVPTKLFKAIYDPARNREIIVMTPNANVQQYEVITPSQLKSLTGITPFPTVKNPTQLTLPPLHRISGSCRKGE